MSDEILERGRKRAKDCGLAIGSAGVYQSDIRVYSADCVHRLLGEGVSAFSRDIRPTQNLWTLHKDVEDSHTALLIGIRPLVQESEEHKLLRQAINLMDALGYSERVEKFAKDVRACLDKRGV